MYMLQFENGIIQISVVCYIIIPLYRLIISDITSIYCAH